MFDVYTNNVCWGLLESEDKNLFKIYIDLGDEIEQYDPENNQWVKSEIEFNQFENHVTYRLVETFKMFEKILFRTTDDRRWRTAYYIDENTIDYNGEYLTVDDNLQYIKFNIIKENCFTDH